MKCRGAWAMLCALMLLMGCTNPVPPEKSAYVGHWTAPGLSLRITQDGSVDYRRVKGAVTTTISAPLKKFEGDNFVVGIGLWTTTFVVSSAPREDGGRWKMTVDGVEVTRASSTPFGQPALTNN